MTQLPDNNTLFVGKRLGQEGSEFISEFILTACDLIALLGSGGREEGRPRGKKRVTSYEPVLLPWQMHQRQTPALTEGKRRQHNTLSWGLLVIFWRLFVPVEFLNVEHKSV